MNKRTNKWSWLVMPLLVLLTAFVPRGDKNGRVDEIQSAVKAYNDTYFQQKVYLHTDRQYYKPGDAIWMKGYVLDEETHQFDDRSTNLYVDMINFRGQTVHQRVLRMNKGTAKGEIEISDTLENGTYRLRAYTGWMHNFSHDFWFSKTIYIDNPEEVYYTFSEKREAKKLQRRIKRTDVQFFPEGGTFVNGLSNTVGIKAVNYQGEGVGFKGQVTTRSGDVVAEVESGFGGMGSFTFTPEKGKVYKARLNFANGRDDKLRLPKRQDEGTVMQVEPNPGKEHYTIQVHANTDFHGNPNARDFIIAAMVRNKLYHIKTYKLKEGTFTARIPKAEFPRGIVHFTLFDYLGKPVAERLVYHHQEKDVLAEKLKTRQVGKDSVRAHFRLNSDKRSGKSGFSMAVISNRQAEKMSQTGISAYFLLTSDLKGKVEQPEWYFKGNYMQKAQALDNLLLTQGWRRFSWNTVLLDQLPKPEYSVQQKLEVAGTITREIVKLPYKNAKVELIVLSKYNDSYKTRSDENGRFYFGNLDYTDSVEMMIKARKPNGSKYVLVKLDKPDFYTPGLEILNPDSFLSDYQYRKRRPYEQPDDPSPNSLHGAPDQVIDVKPYHNSGYSTVFDIIRGRVPGYNNGIIRGKNSFYLSSAPLYLLDGVPVGRGAINSIPVNDIDHVEILKNPSNTAIYGVRGSNGVIAVYTLQGHHVAHGKREFTMLGYHQPREFYRPAFEKAESGDYPMHLKTLYWNPDLKPDSLGYIQTTFPVKHIKGQYMVNVSGVISGIGGVEMQQELMVD